MSELKPEYWDPEKEQLPASFANGDAVPLEIDHLETPATYQLGERDNKLTMEEHLKRMAEDEQYLRDKLRGQLFAQIGHFYIASKAGSYTLDSPDMMVMLAHARKSPPEAHLHELSPIDLSASLKLCNELREETIAHGSQPEHVYIGLAGGNCASIARLHWHVYVLDEYNKITTEDVFHSNPEIVNKLGWGEDQSVANQELARLLNEAGVKAEYDHFSARVQLEGSLEDPIVEAQLCTITRIADSASRDMFQDQKPGYSLAIDSKNNCNIRLTKGKQGIVESSDHYLVRNPNSPADYKRLQDKDYRMGDIIANVLIKNYSED